MTSPKCIIRSLKICRNGCLKAGLLTKIFQLLRYSFIVFTRITDGSEELGKVADMILTHHLLVKRKLFSQSVYSVDVVITIIMIGLAMHHTLQRQTLTL